MATRGRLFPVCCAAELPTETMDRFIAANEGDDFLFVLVDSLTEQYDSISERPIARPSSPDSPFIGKSAHECYELLQNLLEDTGSDIDFDIFAVMDERSTKDDTLLLGTGPAEEGGPAQSIRADFDVADLVVLNFTAGTFGIEELRERVESDGEDVLKRKHLL